MDNRIKLHVMGISYSPVQNGAFALLLAVDDSPVRIPVVIGAPEAQSIAMRLERVSTPRPLTHDLFCSFSQAFGIQLREVFIYKFEDGIYSSEMTFDDGERTVSIDSRTSDAIAIAMRCGALIYTTPAIVDECGIELEEVEAPSDADNQSNDAEDPAHEAALDKEMRQPEIKDPVTHPNLPDHVLQTLTTEQLQQRMAFLSENEDYEGAARVAAVLRQRTEK